MSSIISLHSKLDSLSVAAQNLSTATTTDATPEQAVKALVVSAQSKLAFGPYAHTGRNTSRPWLQIEAPIGPSQAVSALSLFRAKAETSARLFELGTPDAPVRLRADAIKAREQHGAEEQVITAMMMALVEQNFSAQSIARTPPNLDMAIRSLARCVKELILLKFDAVQTSASAEVRGALESIVARVIEEADPLIFMVSGPCAHKNYSATAAGYAARYQDADAFERIMLRQKDPLFIEAMTRSIGVKLGPLMLLLATAAVETPHWDDASPAGAAILRCIMRHIQDAQPGAPAHRRQELVNAVLLLVIKARRKSALELVVQSYEASKSHNITQESPYLLWAAQFGWKDGIDALLRAGLNPGARDPGYFIGHPHFSCGVTPLIAALTSKALTDEVSHAVSVTLLRQGASPYQGMAHAGTGIYLTTPESPQAMAERAGLGRRWSALAGELVAHTVTREASHHARISAAVARLAELATKINANVEPVDAATLMLCLQGLHDAALHDCDLTVIHNPAVPAFVIASGSLFSDQKCPERPYLHQPESCDYLYQHDGYFGLDVERSPGTLEARQRVWATKALQLTAQTSEIQSGSGLPAPLDPNGWMSHMSDVLISGAPFVATPELPMLMLLGRIDEVLAVLRLKEHRTPAERALVLFIAIATLNEAKQTAAKPELEAIVNEVISQCADAATARALVEMALRAGYSQWLVATLTQVLERRLSLIGTGGDEVAETLLHVAAQAPLPVLKSFCTMVSQESISVWSQQQDGAGDTPLHRAAREGTGKLKVIVGRLDKAQVRAIGATTNAAGRTPALEALVCGQSAAFIYLSRLSDGLNSGQALIKALASRRGVVTPQLMAVLMANPHAAQLLTSHAQTLARRLARLGDHVSLDTVLRQLGQTTLKPSPGASTIVHALAKSGSQDVLAVLTAVASQAQLRALADCQDGRGYFAEVYANEPALAQLLSSWRTQTPGLPSPAIAKTRPLEAQLRALVSHVSKQSQSNALERCVATFCSRAESILAKDGSEPEIKRVIDRVSWEVIDHIDRAPVTIGVRMGIHLDMHRPDVLPEDLMARAKASRTGASRFSYEGGLALLKARSRAITRAKQANLRLGLRMVIDVPALGLNADGFNAFDGRTQAFSKSEILRTVFTQTPHGLLLITAYAI